MTEETNSLILKCNKLAMEWLRKGNINKSEENLAKAQAYLHTKQQSKQTAHLWSITFNNLGCLYKRKEEYDLALKYLDLALEYVEKNTKEAVSIAGIHLNISAILSQLGNHEYSLINAAKAKKILQNIQDKDQNTWVSLIISYHSVGSELEKLHRVDSASNMYLKGWELAQDHLGAFHNITEGIKKNYWAMQKKNSKLTKLINRSKTPALMTKLSHNIIIHDQPERNKSVVSKTKRGKIFKLDPKLQTKDSDKNMETLNFIIKDLDNWMRKSDSSTEVERMVRARVEVNDEKISKASIINNNKEIKDRLKHTELKNSDPKIEASESYSLQFEDDECYEELISSINDEEKQINEPQEDNEEKAISIYQEDNHIKEININKEENKDIINEEINQDKIEIPNEIKIDDSRLEIESEPCGKSINIDLNMPENSKLFIESGTQTEEKAFSENFTQSNYIINQGFRRIAAIMIQREWRKYKGKREINFSNYLNQIEEAQKNAQLAIKKVERLKIELQAKENKTDKEELPKPKKSKVNFQAYNNKFFSPS